MERKFLGQTTKNLYRILSHFEYMHVFLKGKELFRISGKMEDAIERLGLIEPLIEVTNKKTLIKIETGDILDYTGCVEALISPTNTALKSSGGVGHAIQMASGSRLMKELEKVGPQSLGTSFVTDGYDLKCEKIIHTVAPSYIDGFHFEEDRLKECYENSLQAALDHNIRSVAIPSISTGGKGFPLDKAVKIAVNTTYDFVMEHEGEMDTIYFVLNNKDTQKMYMTAYKTAFLHLKHK